MKIEQVVVLGTGPTGLMAAAVLKRVLGWRTGVVLVESGRSEPRVWSARLAPSFLPLAAFIGLGEDEIMRECRGAFFCGTRYEGWSQYGEPFVVPHMGPQTPIDLLSQERFPVIGHGFSPVDLWARSRVRGNADRFLSSRPELVAFFEGNLAPKRGPGMEPYHLAPRYGLHVDDKTLTRLLRRQAANLGVVASDSPIASVVPARDGCIEEVRFVDGTSIAATLYVDCSGDPHSPLFAAAGGRFVPAVGPLTCDRAVVARCVRAAKDEVPIVTTVRRTDAGWIYAAPLADGTALVHVYDSSAIDDERATSLLKELVGMGAAIEDLEISAVLEGAAERAWMGNCVAVGPVVSSVQDVMGLYWLDVAHQLGSLLVHLSSGRDPAALGAGHDKGVRAMHLALQDLLVAQVSHSGESESSFWRRARERARPSDQLLERTSAFRSGMPMQSAFGRSATSGGLPVGLFDRATYAALLSGLGLEPEGYPGILDHLDLEPYGEYRRALNMFAAKMGRELPSHGAYLDALFGAELV